MEEVPELMRNVRHYQTGIGSKLSPISLKKLKMPEAPAPFASNDKLIEIAGVMFSCRQRLAEKPEEMEKSAINALNKLESAWTRYWHRRTAITQSMPVSLACLMNQHNLSQVERELVVALVMSRLGLLGEDLDTCKDLLAFLQIPRSRLISALRLLSEHGRLFRLGLITHDDPEEDLRDREIIVSPSLVSGVLNGGSARTRKKKVRSEVDCFKRIIALQSALETRSFILDHFQAHERRGLLRTNSNICRIYSNLQTDLSQNPVWKLNELFDDGLCLDKEERLMLLFLVGRELNVVSGDENAPTGAELARISAESAEDAISNLAYLRPRGDLVRENLLQPCGGDDPLMASDDRTLAGTEYELTEKAQDLFGLQKSGVKKTGGKFNVRPAKVSLSQLVLSETVQRSISMAIAQARNADKLIRDWGLGEVIPYGRGVTILFSGPPGTGKTACAEAVAHELQRPILVADYASILNCYVGNTQKNITRIFREARKNKAVLFWDEADAMFYSRDMARHTWEVQDANVILTELEKFDGVCILATNRKVALDPALERRISLKIEFTRPEQMMRRQIWQRLLPAKLPIADGVDLDELAKADLSGGEIKNAVLNAARMALSRDDCGQLMRDDFIEAIRLEREGRIKSVDSRVIGFSF